MACDQILATGQQYYHTGTYCALCHHASKPPGVSLPSTVRATVEGHIG